MSSVDQLFAELLANDSLTIPSSWGQGRTVFGGLSAALIHHAMRQELDSSRSVRVNNVQFIGPLLVDKPFHIDIVHLRDGKNVTQLQGQIIQDGQVAVMVLAAFGAERSSKISIGIDAMQLGEPPKKAHWIPVVPKIIPKFLSHIEMKVEQGGAPFTGRKSSHYEGWMRFKQQPQQFTDAHIIALIDAWPPAVIQMLKWPAPASTLSWNVEFLHPHPILQPADWLFYHCETRQAADGYAHAEASIFAPNGSVIALSRQVIAVFG